jgi:GGDEF domain-containing protein
VGTSFFWLPARAPSHLPRLLYRNRDGPVQIAEKLLGTLNRDPLPGASPISFTCSIGIGIAMLGQTGPGNTAAELIARADSATYQAKQAGDGLCKFG